VETVGMYVTLMGSMMSVVAHFSSVEQHITAAIENSIYFEQIRYTGCSLHHQWTVVGIVKVFHDGVGEQMVDEWSNQAEGHKEEDENSGT
jgi:hypothetical protein